MRSPSSEPLTRLAHSLLGLLRTRVELLEVELQEEKFRAISLVIWFAAAVAVGTAGILILAGLLGVWLWQVGGYWGLLGLSGGCLGAATVIVLVIQRRLFHGAIPFAESINEIRKDVACLNIKD